MQLTMKSKYSRKQTLGYLKKLHARMDQLTSRLHRDIIVNFLKEYYSEEAANEFNMKVQQIIDEESVEKIQLLRRMIKHDFNKVYQTVEIPDELLKECNDIFIKAIEITPYLHTANQIIQDEQWKFIHKLEQEVDDSLFSRLVDVKPSRDPHLYASISRKIRNAVGHISDNMKLNIYVRKYRYSLDRKQ